jgi:DNA helicase II / ATP-dependent DNA helicase PcrA
MDLLSTLNPQQSEAVQAKDGPLLILAGAGSGKTRVITVRIAHLIADRGVQPYNILAVTFTNKAAGEMRERVEQLLRGSDLKSAPMISTFHSLCVRILRRNIEALQEGYTRSFTIYDQDDSVRLVKGCLKDLGYDDKALTKRSVQSAISAAKNRGEDPDTFAVRVEYGDEKRASIARVFKLYEERLRNSNALDFDALITKTVHLLRRDKEVREYYNNRFRYILVDEYQDTNSLQFALIRFLTEKQQNICVVGDPDQSIYKWRGADISNILNFEKHYPKTTTIRLEQNYRSTQTILDTAAAVVRHNRERKDKNLWTSNPSGERIRYYQAHDGDTEARFVATMIEDHRRLDPEIRAAVLYRTNAQSRVFEESMRRARIDYNIVGGFSFYERMEVRDIIGYLKLALNPNDNMAFMRVINTPTRGIGKQSLDVIERTAKEGGASYWDTIPVLTTRGDRLSSRAITSLKSFQKIIAGLSSAAKIAASSDSPVSDVVKAAILDTGYSQALKAENTDEAEARIENLQELVNAAVDYDRQDEDGLRDFIDHSALVSDADQYKRDAGVTLMTMHAAKGLEFPLVFIVGLEDGLFPHSRSATDPAELEEERRICYVAITRAEQFLYVTHAMKRRVYGEELAAEPSQFLNEMPLDLMEDLSRGASWLSFARGSSSLASKVDSSARGEVRGRTKYTGKTYDNVDSIAEFFRKRGQKVDPAGRSTPTVIKSQKPAASSGAAAATSPASNDFKPGTHVRHAKYGRGLVLKREGAGESAKLTVSFPGFGQKKLVERYAGLVKA